MIGSLESACSNDRGVFFPSTRAKVETCKSPPYAPFSVRWVNFLFSFTVSGQSSEDPGLPKGLLNSSFWALSSFLEVHKNGTV